MNWADYNIKKRFALMPSLIQIVIYFLCSAFMIIKHTVIMKITERNMLNYLEETIFWFFLFVSLIMLICILVSMFTYNIPSLKNFKIYKAIFYAMQLIMAAIALSGAITFLASKVTFLGHDNHEFYKVLVIVVLISMSILSLLVIFPIFLLKNPKEEDENEQGHKQAKMEVNYE